MLSLFFALFTQVQPVLKGMQPMKTTAATVIVLMLLGATSPTSAEIVNGGFETGDFTGWTRQGSGDFILSSGAPEGSCCAVVEANNANPYSRLMQSFSANAGDQFSVLARYSGEGNCGIWLEDEEMNTVFSPTTTTNWQTYSYTITETGNYVINASAMSEPTIGGLSSLWLDAVRVTPVPEPSTVVLLGIGAIGLLAWRRRAA